MHEHVFILSPDVQQNYPLGWDDERRVDEAVTRLNELKSRGVDSIVEAGDAGPNVVGHQRHPQTVLTRVRGAGVRGLCWGRRPMPGSTTGTSTTRRGPTAGA